jgi:hypothetical protein
MEVLHDECNIIHTSTINTPKSHHRSSQPIHIDFCITCENGTDVLKLMKRLTAPFVRADWMKDRGLYLRRKLDRSVSLSRGHLKLAGFRSVRNVKSHDEKQYFSIQLPLMRAPEVILKAGWSYPADLWNLGVQVSITPNPSHRTSISKALLADPHTAQAYELLENKPLFVATQETHFPGSYTGDDCPQCIDAPEYRCIYSR